MRAPISWLQEFVDIPFSHAELAEKLIALGLKVEKIHKPGDDIDGVVVAEVASVLPHPNADNLVLVELVTATGDSRVVCGAKNFSAGDKVALARPGARLPGMPPLEAKKIRGEVSEGMLCSARELQIGDDQSGILVLPKQAQIGQDVTEVLSLNDAIFEFEVTANRPDVMSLIGVAYEVAALTGGEVRMPAGQGDFAQSGKQPSIKVDIQDPGGCGRYLALEITGLQVGPSPIAIQNRLRAAGIRPISNVVDASNYVLLVTGQPLHAFDKDKLKGGQIVVRRARPGENLKTIDGTDRSLEPDDLVISDAENAVAIAGIMGGLESEVSDSTRTIILESAYFQPASIFRSAKRHGLRSEASARFERGADIEMVPFAAQYAASLMKEWNSDANVEASAKVDVFPRPPARPSVRMRIDRVNTVLGTSLSPEAMASALSRLALQPTVQGNEISINPPSRRRDLAAEEDLIEEVARVTGYDNIPYSLPPTRSRAGSLTQSQRLTRKARQVLTGSGFHEAWTSILIGAEDIEATFSEGHWLEGAPEIANPMSKEESLLRPSLIPGLLNALKYNFARRNTVVRLFEVGTCFGRTDGYPVESLRVGIVAGGRADQEWHSPKRALDFFDLKGAVESLLSAFSLTAGFEPKAVDPFHPGRSAAISVEGRVVGFMGELDRDAAERLDLAFRPSVTELDFSSLLQMARNPEPPPKLGKFPAIYLDIAVRVPEDVPSWALLETARVAGGDLLEEVRLFDVYEGEQVGAGMKSLAFALTMRSPERTLKESEGARVLKLISSAFQKEHGAELRS